MNDFLAYGFFNFVCLLIAFIGLRGALMKNLRIVPLYGRRVNHTGKRAVIWGILIFLAFLALPFFFFYSDISRETYTLVEGLRDFTVSIIAFLAAMFYRKLFGAAR